MEIVVIIILALIFVLAIWAVFNLFTLSIDDFFKKIWAKTLWIWLPFHALKRLSKELWEKKK